MFATVNGQKGLAAGSPLLSAANKKTYNSVGGGEVASGGSISSSGDESSSFHEEHLTSPAEAFLNLLKGYFGAGMLRCVRDMFNECFGKE